jgi:hypothetical protein
VALQFSFVGKKDGGFVFAARTSGIRGIVALTSENEVAEWMLEQANGEWYLGNEAILPDVRNDGFTLYAVLRRVVDVIQFERRFSVSGLTLDSLEPMAA